MHIGEENFYSTADLINENQWYELVVSTDCYYTNNLWVNGTYHEIDNGNMDMSYPSRNLYIGHSNGIDYEHPWHNRFMR